ncbi:hypothetical protein Bpfe_006062 [Biomphalaria pfeifferi]|uniref:Uncharacterized protein n=1 Tax=Biomphalaria pfeifferi TaxID=112525 RepID=A0AAD8C293_BIOPF|nr:hypothetical protein Bpfe_006062 [Biomphalaria pfeifferi]
MATANPAFCSTWSKDCEIRSTDCEAQGHPLLSTNELANGTPHVTSQDTDGVQELPGHVTSETMHQAGQSDLSVITNVVPTTIMPSTPSELVGVRAKPPLRRVISNLDHMTGTLDQLRPIRRINSFSDVHSKQNDPLQPPAQKVRFFTAIPQNKSKLSQDDNSSETINALQDIATLSRSRMSSFKNFFRGSSKRKKRKSVEEAPDVDKLDCNCNRKSATAPSVVHDEAGKEVSALEDHVIVEPGESDDFEADLIDGTLFSKPKVTPFQRSHSTKSRMKPVIEEEDLEPRHFARSVTEGNFLYQAPTLLLTTISYPNEAPLHFQNAAERPQFSKRDSNGAKQRRGHFNRENRLWRHRSEGHSPSGPRQSIRKHVVHILTGLKKLHGDSHYQPKSSFRGLHGYFCFRLIISFS